jgi:surface protein
MFKGAQSFNGDLSDWDVSHARAMNGLFQQSVFNGDISEWAVDSVTTMVSMFSENSSFNGDISNWNVGKVTGMDRMFRQATNFNQDLSNWNINEVLSMSEIFNFSGLSSQNFDNVLLGWAAQEVRNNVSLGAIGITFCKGSAARKALIDDHSWIINDDGLSCSSETDILSFTIAEQIGASTIDSENHTVTLSVPFVTDRSVLSPVFTLSVGATSNPASGEVVVLISPQTFVITAEDGVTVQEWTITVTLLPNTATELLTFTVNEQVGLSTIDAVTHSVSLSVPFGTDLSDLSPEFTLSSGATSNPANGEVVDLTSPQTYVITAEDGVTVQEWTITVSILSNTATDILTFNVAGQQDGSIIDAINHTVSLSVPFGTDRSDLSPVFTLSAGATSTPVSGEVVDLSSPQTYVITAEDGITVQEWTITVTLLPNTATDLVTFTVNEQVGVSTIDAVNHSVSLLVSFGTDRSSLVPELTLSNGATSNLASGEVLDLSNPQTFVITAEDGISTQEWTITAELAPNTATDILAITSMGEIKDLTIDDIAHTVHIVFADNTDLSSVALEILVSQGATINIENNANLDLTAAVKIIVTAADKVSAQEWTIVGSKEEVLSVKKGQLNISYYPNPVQDVLHINNQDDAAISILDMKGKVVMKEKNGQLINIDMRAFKPGLYMLYVRNANSASTYKIIKQ